MHPAQQEVMVVITFFKGLPLWKMMIMIMSITIIIIGKGTQNPLQKDDTSFLRFILMIRKF